MAEESAACAADALGPLIVMGQSQCGVDSETASLDTGGVRAGTAQGAGPVRREAACALCGIS